MQDQIIADEFILPLSLPDSIQQLLSRYYAVFSIPHGLPPSRSCDHRIHLLPNSNLVKVRPYKYVHAHKFEIEHMVAQKLSKGLIKPSNIPFSSP